jgi:hypothetical protein
VCDGKDEEQGWRCETGINKRKEQDGDGDGDVKQG